MGVTSREKLLPSLLAAAILAAGWVFVTTPSAGPPMASSDACEDCHADISEKFHATPHGIYLSGSAMPQGGACQSCHGPGGAHVDSGDPADIVNPARTGLIADEATCLACHDEENHLSGWAMSNHRNAGVRCADCHAVHVEYEADMAAAPAEKCYECHAEVRAAAYMPSHHPVAEGKLRCTDCHNVHGDGELFAMENTTRETCLRCHAGHEGPFIYEHPPVNEDCTICHSPHGSVADNLLVQSEPALCLNCHSMHFHAGLVSVDGAFSTPQAPERAGFSTPDGWKKGMLTKCTSCHTEIHGSDLPSQSISGGGAALTR